MRERDGERERERSWVTKADRDKIYASNQHGIGMVWISEWSCSVPWCELDTVWSQSLELSLNGNRSNTTSTHVQNKSLDIIFICMIIVNNCSNCGFGSPAHHASGSTHLDLQVNRIRKKKGTCGEMNWWEILYVLNHPQCSGARDPWVQILQRITSAWHCSANWTLICIIEKPCPRMQRHAFSAFQVMEFNIHSYTAWRDWTTSTSATGELIESKVDGWRFAKGSWQTSKTYEKQKMTNF